MAVSGLVRGRTEGKARRDGTALAHPFLRAGLSDDSRDSRTANATAATAASTGSEMDARIANGSHLVNGHALS